MPRRDMFNEKWSPLENQIADEWVRRDALDTCQGRACAKGCSDACARRCCRRLFAVRCNCFLTLMAIMCIVLLIMLAVMMIGPYIRSKKDKQATCTTVSSDYDTNNMMSCRCSRFCTSYYPCLKIWVKYTRFDGDEVEALLHEDETGGTCTYTPSCSISVDQNTQAVEWYNDKYGKVGTQFSCLYNPAKGSKDVIQQRLNSDTSITHMIVWPLALALAFSLGVVFISKTCGCKYTCKTEPPQEVKVTAARLHQLGVYTLTQLNPEERQRVLRECAPGPGDQQMPNVI